MEILVLELLLMLVVLANSFQDENDRDALRLLTVFLLLVLREIRSKCCLVTRPSYPEHRTVVEMAWPPYMPLNKACIRCHVKA